MDDILHFNCKIMVNSPVNNETWQIKTKLAYSNKMLLPNHLASETK